MLVLAGGNLPTVQTWANVSLWICILNTLASLILILKFSFQFHSILFPFLSSHSQYPWASRLSPNPGVLDTTSHVHTWNHQQPAPATAILILTSLSRSLLTGNRCWWTTLSVNWMDSLWLSLHHLLAVQVSLQFIAFIIFILHFGLYWWQKSAKKKLIRDPKTDYSDLLALWKID